MSNTPIKIGYCLSLTGGLAANGQTARLAHQIWQERVNARGGLLGRRRFASAIPEFYDLAPTMAPKPRQRDSRRGSDLLFLGGAEGIRTPDPLHAI